MSTVDERGLKVVPAVCGGSLLWERIGAEFARDDPVLWQHLAMFALRAQADWSLEQIAALFDLSRGHVSRVVNTVRRDLRRIVEELSPETPAALFLERDDE